MAKIKSHKVATSSAAWSSFGVVTAVTIIIFWILSIVWVATPEQTIDGNGCYLSGY